MAADDIARGAAKAGSWLSDVLGVADEAIAPALRKNLAKEAAKLVGLRTAGTDGTSEIAESFVSSGASVDALKRMGALADRRMISLSKRPSVDIDRNIDLGYRLQMQKDVLSALAENRVADRVRLLNTYGGITDDAAEILNKALERTIDMRRNNFGVYKNELDDLGYDKSKAIESARAARLGLLNSRMRFQQGLFADDLTSEFGETSPAASMFSSFITDGMSPVDARDAVRALLGGQ